ncbi:MAG: NnrS family protein, partial [Verrucomicrobiota bacterium]
VGYLWMEFPFHRAPQAGSALGASLRIAFLTLVGGFLAVAIWPGFRVGLLHMTLVGGFAVITLIVATRVVLGHSGNLDRLKGRNRWLLIVVGVMLLAMATRISGDIWPKVLASHYVYGAILWIAAVLIWAVRILPKVLERDIE